MEKKLVNEYNRLINLYKYTSSKPLKNKILSTLQGIYEICDEYGINVPSLSYYIIGYKKISKINEIPYSTTESDMFVDKLRKRVLQKINKKNKQVLLKMIEKVNRDKYSRITAEYLKENRKELYDLYIKMRKENRIFGIEEGIDYADCDFTTIPYLHEDKNIIIIDSYPTLLCYLAIPHELSHVLYVEKYKFSGKPAEYDAFNDLSEVYPIYEELKMGEYLKKIAIIDKNYAVESSKNEIVQASKKIFIYKDPHFLGRILALNFFDMYKEDEEKAEYNMEKFLRNYEGNDLKTNINSFGLSEEKILSLKAIEGWKYD